MRHFLGVARIALLTACLFLIALSASDSNSVSAQGNKTQGTKKAAAAAQKASNHELVETIQLLHSVKKTLEGADHDYGGHRAAAVHEISKAAKELHEAHQAMHKMHGNNSTAKAAKAAGGGAGGGGAGAKGGAGGTGGAHTEPQALSDSQLAAAVPTLEQAAGALQSASHDFGGHREKAVADLKSAITELGKALKYSKEKDQNKP